MQSKICIAPWNHININPDGNVYPCCLTVENTEPFGNLNKKSLEDIWNGERWRQLRLDFLEGKEPSSCTRCFEREKNLNHSSRIYKNIRFPLDVENAPNRTSKDGTANLALKSWDLRFSNLCNFKCRTCGPAYSSAWLSDALALKQGVDDTTPKMQAVNHISLYPTNEYIDKYISDVQYIYFAGGEPMLMDSHWYILQQLCDKKRFDVHLSYSTNLSVLEYKGMHAVSYWKQFKKGCVEVWPSIDEIGSRAELLRSGTKWSVVLKNLKQLLTIDCISVRPTLTVSSYNVMRLPEIFDFLFNLGLKDISLWLVRDPAHMSIKHLPLEYKQRAMMKILEYGLKQDINIAIFDELFALLREQGDIKMLRQFIIRTEQLDRLRYEDTYKVMPELKEIREQFII